MLIKESEDISFLNGIIASNSGYSKAAAELKGQLWGGGRWFFDFKFLYLAAKFYPFKTLILMAAKDPTTIRLESFKIEAKSTDIKDNIFTILEGIGNMEFGTAFRGLLQATTFNLTNKSTKEHQAFFPDSQCPWSINGQFTDRPSRTPEHVAGIAIVPFSAISISPTPSTKTNLPKRKKAKTRKNKAFENQNPNPTCTTLNNFKNRPSKCPKSLSVVTS